MNAAPPTRESDAASYGHQGTAKYLRPNLSGAPPRGRKAMLHHHHWHLGAGGLGVPAAISKQEEYRAMSRVLLKLAKQSLPLMLLRDFQLVVKSPVVQLV
jgi:hypothetical protein